jgi:hypothetical protein
LPAKLCQPLHAKLSGITEIRLAHDDNTYRVYVTLKCPWIIMVLDAGIKKSTEGKNIPSWQQERLEKRYKKAREYWAGHDAELKTDYDKRKARREAFAKENGRWAKELEATRIGRMIPWKIHHRCAAVAIFLRIAATPIPRKLESNSTW